ncbi:hypothetical protein ABPG75_002021 [Micractinium tetrahymenae]
MWTGRQRQWQQQAVMQHLVSDHCPRLPIAILYFSRRPAMGAGFLVAVLALLLGLGGLVAALLKRSAAQAAGGDGGAQQEVPLGVPLRPVNRAVGDGMRRRRRRRAAAESDEEEEEEEEAERDMREQAPRAPTARDAYEARRAARDAEREAQEAAQEAEIARAAEERRRREEEEAAKWMHLFSVDAAGEEALSKEEGEAQAARFVDYIRSRKTAALEELAAEFGMRTQEVISKVQSLEAEGALTGVMDDRGKFIFISPEEMHAVADFIRSRGRIAIAELAHRSNEFLDLEARELGGGSSELELPPGATAVGA